MGTIVTPCSLSLPCIEHLTVQALNLFTELTMEDLLQPRITEASAYCEECETRSSLLEDKTIVQPTVGFTKDSQDDTDVLFSVADNILDYGRLIIVILGLFGNLACQIVLFSRHYRQTSAGVLLIIISILDTMILFHFGFLPWIGIAFDAVDPLTRDPLIQNSIFCKLYFFFMYIEAQTSSLTVSILSLERLIAVWFPFKAKMLLTRKRTLIAWLACFLCIVALNAVNLNALDLIQNDQGQENSASPQCSFRSDTSRLRGWVEAFPHLDLALVSAVPFAIQAVANTLIIAKLRCLRTKFTNESSSEGTNDGSRNLTYLLFGVSLLFAITTLPLAVNMTIDMYAVYNENDYNAGLVRLRFSILLNLNLLNYAANFVMYCVFCKKFRRIFRTKVKKMLSP